MARAPRPGVMSQASRLVKRGHVQLRTKKENATTAENAGIKKFNLLYMENTNMFHHPNYYKELRKRNKSDQAISDEASTEATSVRPGPGNKLDVPAPAGPSVKHQASSCKPQAPSDSNQELQASSPKQQASSSKPRPESSMIRDPWNI